MDNNFANAFKDYLVVNHDNILKKAMTEVSASANIIKLRTIFLGIGRHKIPEYE